MLYMMARLALAEQVEIAPELVPKNLVIYAIVTDPGDEGQFAEGDILICRRIKSVNPARLYLAGEHGHMRITKGVDAEGEVVAEVVAYQRAV